MIKGHIEIDRKYAITGNREETIINIYDCETKEDIVHFYETYDFEPSDILGLMHYYQIDHSTRYWIDEDYNENKHHCCEINSEGLRFYFVDQQVMYISKKFNVYDELMEKFNLKPVK